MNCYIMAAGSGERLKPLTLTTPKCLLDIGGSPILYWWLSSIFGSDMIEKVFVNVCFHAEQVENFLMDFLSKYGYFTRVIDERRKMFGTAGTLFWYGNELEDFMVVYPDTICGHLFRKKNMKKLIKDFYLQPKEILAGIVTFDAPEDFSAGTLKIDAAKNVISFEEKSCHSNIAWAGVLLCRREVWDYIVRSDKDLAKDILPKLCGKMRVLCHLEAYDIGKGVKEYVKISRKFQSPKWDQAEADSANRA